MAKVLLKLKDIKGIDYTISVPRDIQIEELLDRISFQLQRPVVRISQAGISLEKERKLSNYNSLSLNDIFRIHSPMMSGVQPSIAKISDAEKKVRNERLESHLQSFQNPASRGATKKHASNIKKAFSNAQQILPYNIENLIFSYLGGKRKTKKSKKSRRQQSRRRR
jgi:hypothetical protein